MIPVWGALAWQAAFFAATAGALGLSIVELGKPTAANRRRGRLAAISGLIALASAIASAWTATL